MGDWRVAYDVNGSAGTPVVFVHGWSSHRGFWRPQMDGANPGMRRIALDLIGHGESDKPEDETYSMDFMARSIAAVLDDLGIERAVLVGHSMGVPVVRQFWRLWPDRVLALVLVDGFLRAQPMNPWQTRILEQLKSSDWRAAVEQMAGAAPPGVPKSDVMTEFAASMRRLPQRVLVDTTEASLDPAIWREDAITVPVLVIKAQSPWAPVDASAYEASIRALVPNGEVHVWDDASHVLTHEHPARFNDLLADFAHRAASERRP
jgi:pimeloyl-ACP methyl ester carboxylesterase